MPRLRNKNKTISFRCDEATINKLDKLIEDYSKHSGCYYNSSYSTIIRYAIDYLSKLDLENKDIFMNVFHQCMPSTFKNNDIRS